MSDLNVTRIGRCSPASQSHIIGDLAAAHTLCGVKINNRPNKAGITLARFVQRHIDGHDPEWCERCLYEWSKP